MKIDFIQEHKIVWHFGLMLLTTTGAIFASIYLNPYTEGKGVFLIPLAAVMITSLLGGRWAGLISMILGALGVYYFILEPESHLTLTKQSAVLRLTLFTSLATLIIFLCDAFRRKYMEIEVARRKVVHLMYRQDRLQKVTALFSEALGIEAVAKVWLDHAPIEIAAAGAAVSLLLPNEKELKFIGSVGYDQSIITQYESFF